MMPALLVSSDVPPPVRRYLIAIAGKKRIDFYNNGLFAGDSRLIGYRNPFAGQENSSITSDLCFLQRRRNTTENGREIDALVTTSHLFWPNQPRKARLVATEFATEFSCAYAGKRESHGPPRGGGVGDADPAEGLDRKALTEFLY